MAVSLIEKNYNTNYCEFSYDNWENDKDSIPTMNTHGKGILSTILSCSQGSKAIGTDGTMKILNGDRNEWVDYNASINVGNTGGGSNNDGFGLNIATGEEVDDVLDQVFDSK